jgi:hypothetical protein
MRYTLPQIIKSNIEGFNVFIELYDKTKDLFIDSLIIDFSLVKWFDANLLAILGALINIFQDALVDVKLENISSNHQKLFERNHFSSNFGGTKIPDKNKSTIKYKKFSAFEDKIFTSYLLNELFSKSSMPKMSEKLKPEITLSLLEVYNNAVYHGKCDSVFTCGQYFPVKKTLDFTIVDIGKTIKKNVSNFLKTIKTGEEAIKWAVTPGNTTKTGSIPGGNGLKLITDFLNVNKGKFQIISFDGYFEQNNGLVQSSSFQLPFPGTIVNFEFKTDSLFYCFKSELSPNDIL